MLYQTLAQRFVADSFIACSCHVHPLSCRVIRVMGARFPSCVCVCETQCKLRKKSKTETQAAQQKNAGGLATARSRD